jgi:excisionase family DNA binding protein
MTAVAHETLPNEELAEQSAEVLSFINAHESKHGTRPDPTYFLCGADEHDRVELTEGIYEMFKDLLGALAERKSVQILAHDQELTTQQAAEILGLSRPTVVKLIKTGEIPAHVPGVNRRKLRLADVLAYRDQLYKQRNEFIAESSAAYEIDEDLVDIDDLVNEARKNR